MRHDLTDEEAQALVRVLREGVQTWGDLGPVEAGAGPTGGFISTSRLRAAEQGAIPPTVMRSNPGPPATLGTTAAARARIVVWCRDCRHRVEPDPAEMARRYGAETSVLDWHKRLVCSKCGSRDIDFVLTAARR